VPGFGKTSVDLVLQGSLASVHLHRDGLSVMDPLSADNLWDDQLSEMAVCKGNLTNLRSLSLAKGNPKRML
jgi:hypothetical protein